MGEGEGDVKHLVVFADVNSVLLSSVEMCIKTA